MDEKNLEHVKSQIDELNKLCDEVVPRASEEDRRKERLGVLLLRLQENDLEPRFIRRLEKWLLADHESLNYYVDFMSLTALLHLHFHPEQAVKGVPFSPHHS